jgi:hypothetical protein
MQLATRPHASWNVNKTQDLNASSFSASLAE